jgi:hypothetical protein
MYDTLKTLIKIILLIIIVVVIFYYINSSDPKVRQENFTCDLENLNLDDLVIINRNPEYIKLINKLIDDKSFIFTDDQLKILKNPNQFYDISNNNVKNISNIFYKNCDGKLDSVVNNTEYFDNSYELNIDADNQYNEIVKEFKNNINNTLEPDCKNSCILSDPKYLKNYYMDLYGNKVKSNLIDYYADYYTNINNNNKECLPVDTLVGIPNFIIPDQYNIEKYLTNAYNVDWSRIINPNTIL